MQQNLTMVIFGGTGDLTRRKLIPALAMLDKDKHLPEQFKIVGVGRTDHSHESYRQLLKDSLQEFGGVKADKMINNTEYCQLDPTNEKAYSKLRELLQPDNNKNLLYYLAVPPELYQIIPTLLCRNDLAGKKETPRRIIIEKPFGRDSASVKELNNTLLNCFEENEIFRIDHFLGKETAQNLLVTRFANGIFEPLWNRNYIDRIEITAAESIGVGSRSGYYESSGALRDMMQNHILQLVALTAMEPPASFSPEQIQNETLKVFQSLRPLSETEIRNSIIRGQYTSASIQGEKKLSYREEAGVNPESKTETYLAMRCFIDNWRWSGVPFYLRSGKRLPTRVTEIVIHFKKNPHALFCDKSGSNDNSLIIRIQPDEGILLKIGMKVPGAGFETQISNMEFHYSSRGEQRLPSAYERLLLDAMNGDRTLYPRKDAVEKCWDFIEPLLQAWKNDPKIPLHGYPAGTWGPNEADSLIPEKGWRYPCRNLSNDGIFCEL